MQKKTIDTRMMILCGLFAALIAVGAFIRIPVPVVPFTMQVFFVILAGLILGSKGGAIAAGVYLFIGLAGVPVFTKGGGIGYVFQPTFGYIIGFVVGAYVVGKILEKTGDRSYKNMMIASFVGMAVIYIIGMAYYYVVANYYLGKEFGVKALLWYCCFMTLPGDIISSFLGAYIAKRVEPVLKRPVVI